MDLKEKILNNIKTIRESKNYNEKYVSSKLNMGQSSYSKKETGDTEFTLTEFIKLGEVFGVSVAKLIDLDLAKVINQQNQDLATGNIIENQHMNEEGYKLCILQYKEENSFLRQQIGELIKSARNHL